MAEKTEKNIIDVEVAVAFTDGTWTGVMTSVGDPKFDLYSPTRLDVIEKKAEDQVLKDFTHSLRAVAFVKAIWVDPGEEE